MSRILQRLFICIGLVTLLFGCGKEKQGEKRAAKFEIVDPFTNVGSPVTVRLKASKKEITIADFLTLVVEAESARGSTVTLPELKDMNFGQFLVKDHFRLPSVKRKEGSEVQAIEFTLEPQLSGEYTIESFKVPYTQEGEAPDPEGNLPLHEIQTQPITITVKSLGAKDSQTAKLRDIQPPVSLPRPRKTGAMVRLAIVTFALLAAGVLWVVLVRRKKKRIPIARKIAAHLLAFEELRRLREMNLIDQGRIKEFYIAISNIMRFYIERRFGIRAPEQTTEEFLESVSRDHLFESPTRDVLKQFLSHCDMVKFARYQPETAEIQKTFDITLDFIERTRQEDGG